MRASTTSTPRTVLVFALRKFHLNNVKSSQNLIHKSISGYCVNALTPPPCNRGPSERAALEFARKESQVKGGDVRVCERANDERLSECVSE